MLGAVYLDGGVEAAKALVARLFSERLDVAAGQLDRLDHKTVLQELTARLYDTAPVYLLTESGPDHSKTFKATVLGRRHGAGRRARASRRSLPSSRPRPRHTTRSSAEELVVPELPEVETVRRGMVSFVVGRRIERVEVGRERTVRRTSSQALIDGLTGSTITSIGRRGKYILCTLDTGDALMIHLRMSGRVLVSAAGSHRPDHTHVVLHLAGAPAQELWFVDPRTFGEMVVFDPDHVDAELPELARLGIDPITDGLTVAQLTGMLRGRARQLKPLLLDQHVIAGIGNIYCDEILHRARLRPDRSGQHVEAGRRPPPARCDPLDPVDRHRGWW